MHSTNYPCQPESHGADISVDCFDPIFVTSCSQAAAVDAIAAVKEEDVSNHMLNPSMYCYEDALDLDTPSPPLPRHATVLDEEGINAEENLEDKMKSELKSIVDQIFNDTSGPELFNPPADSNPDRTLQEEEREEVTPVVTQLTTVVEMPSESGSTSIDEGNIDYSRGGENRGRWTAEEHRLFLTATRQYGRKWKKISKMLRTRTPVQVRTHAIKYYAKLSKARTNDEKFMIGGISDHNNNNQAIGRPSTTAATTTTDVPNSTSTDSNTMRIAVKQRPQHTKVSGLFGTLEVDCSCRLFRGCSVGCSDRACQINDWTKKALFQNSGHWNADEHLLFLAGVRVHGKNWKKVAEVVRTRSTTQIRTHAQKYYSKLIKGGKYCETNVLYSGADMAVAATSAPRSIDKYKSNNAPYINTGRWTAEEHQLFLSLVAKHGENCQSWKKIAEVMKTRTAVQVRTHAQKWQSRASKEIHDGEMNVLYSGSQVATAVASAPRSIGKYKSNNAPYINTGRWTPEEHQRFLPLLAEHGKSWKKIAEVMKTRTAMQVRTHAQKYYAKLSKEMGAEVTKAAALADSICR